MTPDPHDVIAATLVPHVSNGLLAGRVLDALHAAGWALTRMSADNADKPLTAADIGVMSVEASKARECERAARLAEDRQDAADARAALADPSPRISQAEVERQFQAELGDDLAPARYVVGWPLLTGEIAIYGTVSHPLPYARHLAERAEAYGVYELAPVDPTTPGQDAPDSPERTVDIGPGVTPEGSGAGR